MNGLAILVVVAICIFISPYLARLARLPVAPVEIILGALFGFAGLLVENEIFSSVAKLGFYYLMFLAGMHIDVSELSATPRKTVKFAIFYLTFLYAVSGLCAFFSPHPFFVFTLVSLMSVGMLSTLNKDYGKQDWIDTAMLVGVLGELVSIFLLTIAGAYVKFGISVGLFSSIGYLCVFIAVCVLVFKGFEVLFWWFPNLGLLLMPHYDKEEKDIRLCIALFLAMMAVMLWLGIEVAFGAFIAGSFIATFFEHKKDLPRRLGGFGFGFLVPIFFVYVGSTLSLEAISNLNVLKLSGLIIALTLALRIAGALIFSGFVEFKKRVLFGFSLSMPLTLLIAVATIAFEASVINEEVYFALVLASVFEVIFVTSAIKIIKSNSNLN